MNKRTLRSVILSVLAIGIVLGAAFPAWADHTGFSKREYQVSEDASYVELTVETSCCPLGSGRIDYYTSNASAIAGEDYQQTSGTLTFPAEYTIRVPITNDELFESEEQFAVSLTNFRGTFINNAGGTVTAAVRILDDETPPSSSSATAISSGSSSSRSSRGAGLPGPVQQMTAPPALPPKESSTSEIVNPPQEIETPVAEGAPATARNRKEAESQHTFPAALSTGAYAVAAGAALLVLWRRRLGRSRRNWLG